MQTVPQASGLEPEATLTIDKLPPSIMTCWLPASSANAVTVFSYYIG